MNPDSQTNQTLDQEISPLIGRVKWFNNKAGYGFITIMSETTAEPNKGSDIFVHHTSINVVNEQYKYLVQGEYVQFQIIHSTDAEHEYQAGKITGILNGKLMCETIKDIKTNKIQFRQSNTSQPLDTQQMLALPVFNTGVSYGEEPDFTTPRRRVRAPKEGGGAPPPTPRKRPEGRRQSFFQPSH